MAEWRNRIVGEGEMAPIDLMEAANPNNPRLHPDRQEQVLEDVLDKVGFIDRVIVNKRTGKLIDGHLRVKMAMAKGEARLPVEYVDLSPEEEKLVLATFDPIAGLAEFDPEILKGLAESVRLDFDFDLSGVFGEGEFDSLTTNVSGGVEPQDVGPQIDRAAELQEKWQCEAGQIWQIESNANPGQYHRLICGDCRNRETIEQLTQGRPVNGVFTSPPYAMQRARQYGGVPTNEYVDWWEAVQANVRAVLAEDGSFFVNIKPHCEDGQRVLYVFDLVLAMVRRWGWRFVDELCWMRRAYPGDYKDRFKNGFEPLYHFGNSNNLKFNPQNVLKEIEFSTRADKRKATYQEHIKKGKVKPETNSPFDSSVAMMPYGWEDGVRPNNVIEAHLAISDIPQAAQFPLKLPAFFIKAYSDPLDTWLDPFCGSGTVIAACESENRLGYGIEKLEKYCAVILERFETTFGIKPELISDLRT